MGLVALILALTRVLDPALCVDGDGSLADDVVDALRVRMEAQHVRVLRCELLSSDPPAWRVTIRPAGDDVLALSVEGNVTWSQELDVHELRAGELSRLVALHVVEAVRESVSAVASSEPEPEEAPPPEPAHASVALELHAGPVIGIEPADVVAQVQGAAKWRLDATSVLGVVAVRNVSGAERLEVAASGLELHLAAAVRRRFWERVELGAHLRGRAALVTISGEHPDVVSGRRTYFDYGAGLSELTWLWRGEQLAFGLVCEATVWARPHWLSVEGQELLRQPRIDVFLGPVLELTL